MGCQRRREINIVNLDGALKRFANICRLSLFIVTCRVCGQELVFHDEIAVCRDCKDDIKPDRSLQCNRCARPVASNHPLCGDCILRIPPFRKHRFYSLYAGILKDIILLYKYGEVRSLKTLLADLYAWIYGVEINEDFDYIVPVPADSGRHREFKPLAAVGRILSKKVQIKLLTGNLVKIKKTPPQAVLTRKQRLKNLDGAFRVKNPQVLKGKKVLLIDDVYTTGTTIEKCSRCLVEQKVDVVAMTLARSL